MGGGDDGTCGRGDPPGGARPARTACARGRARAAPPRRPDSDRRRDPHRAHARSGPARDRNAYPATPDLAPRLGESLALRIYDTLTREKREFVPVNPGKAGMYVCGMTVQSKPHVGHIRASLSGEVMRRYLEHLGYEVTYVYNFTDVDDKIIARANQEGIDFGTVSERNIEAYLHFADLHNILRATVYPRATKHIDEMFAIMRTLIEKGHAYPAAGDVYYRVRSKADYGKLSGRNVDDMRSGARIEPGEAKEDPLDFALWKGAKPGEPAWESPWGPGRPGWHIECSAMAMKYLGETFDIHGGGQDLIFPHHENEIAQSEAATGKPLSQFWTENGMVNLSGEKMSKSTGNLFFIEDIAART